MLKRRRKKRDFESSHEWRRGENGAVVFAAQRGRVKSRFEGLSEIIYGLLVIAGCCTGAVAGIAGAVWIDGVITEIRFGVNESYGNELTLILIAIIGATGGFIAGGFFIGWLIVKLSNRNRFNDEQTGE